MPEVDIPNRSLFKSSEVCEIASVQPYVLRSWESEFPDLGVTKGNGGARIYRRNDVQRVLRIKQLVFADGLTLAGVRRRIEEEAPTSLEESAVELKQLLGRHARERLSEVRQGLRAILDLLSSRPNEDRVLKMARPVQRTVRAKPQSRAAKPTRRKAGRSRR